MALHTKQIRLGGREHAFHYPKAEEGMILSVLEGRDYPLAKARLGGDSPVIIDIGSNCGAAALYFKSHIPGARVICYEPSAPTHELLVANVGAVDGIETNPCGIWNREGTFRLHHAPGGHTGAATLQPSDGWPNNLGGEDITTRKLSTELRRLQLASVDCSRWTPRLPSRRSSTRCSRTPRMCRSETSTSSTTPSPSANTSPRSFAQDMTATFAPSVLTGKAPSFSS